MFTRKRIARPPALAASNTKQIGIINITSNGRASVKMLTIVFTQIDEGTDVPGPWMVRESVCTKEASLFKVIEIENDRVLDRVVDQGAEDLVKDEGEIEELYGRT